MCAARIPELCKETWEYETKPLMLRHDFGGPTLLTPASRGGISLHRFRQYVGALQPRQYHDRVESWRSPSTPKGQLFRIYPAVYALYVANVEVGSAFRRVLVGTRAKQQLRAIIPTESDKA